MADGKPQATVNVRAAPSLTTEHIKANLETAWRSHNAQEAWTSKVDTKASIIFAFNGAALLAILAMRSQAGSRLALLGGWREVVFTVAIILCVGAAFCAGTAVIPMLGRVKDHRERRDTIYFGHLRHRQVDDLAKQLEELTPAEHFRQMARQLIAMSKRNWAKHRLLQLAIFFAAVGYPTLIYVAFVT